MLRWLTYLFQESTTAIKHRNSSSKHLGQQQKQQHRHPHNLLSKNACLKRDICVTSNILLIDKMLQYQWDVNLVHKAWLCNSVTAPSSEVFSLTGFNKLTHKLTK